GQATGARRRGGGGRDRWRLARDAIAGRLERRRAPPRSPVPLDPLCALRQGADLADPGRASMEGAPDRRPGRDRKARKSRASILGAGGRSKFRVMAVEPRRVVTSGRKWE